jgi:hypothetical protein
MTQQKTAWFVQYKDNREIIVDKRIICYLNHFTTTTKFFISILKQILKEWKQNRPWLVDTETGMVCSYCKEQQK